MSIRTVGPALVGLLLAVALAGCGSAATETYPVVTGPTADDSGLVPAQHPPCDRGPAILHYLSSGDNGGDPAMDQMFAGSVGASKPQARALADKWIAACDQQYASREAAAASSAAAAQAEASYQASASASAAAASASEAAVAAEEQRSCAGIGGQAHDGICQSASQGNTANDAYYPCSALVVQFAEDGTIDQNSLHDVTADHPGCFR